jgi:uncharacterized peroxidase-related enzyme
MRIAPLEADQADKKLQRVYESLEKQYGTALNPLRVLAHKPAIMEAVMRLYGAIHAPNEVLSEELKEMLSVRIAQINGCRSYCVPYHSYMLRHLGTPEDKIQAIAQGSLSPQFSEMERLCLEYAERITVPTTSVSEEFFGKLKAHFSQEDVVELTAFIGMLNFWTKVIDAMEVPLDDIFKSPQGD